MLVVWLLSLTVLVFGTRIVLLAVLLYPQLAGLMELMLYLRFLGMSLVLWLAFIFLYRSIPDQRFTFREVRSSAALAAAAWMLFSGLFSLYAGRFWDLSLYGSMAAMALTMLWLFYCQYIILAGAGLCAWKRKEKEAVLAKTAS